MIVCVGLPAEAFAAVPHAATHAIGSLGDVVVHYAPHMASIIAVLRSDLSALEKRAADKLAEVKDGMEATAIRKIEDDHAAIAADIKAKKDEIAAEERRLADEDAASRRNQGDNEAAVRAATTAAVADALRAERTRTATIRSLAASVGAVELGEEHAGRDTSIDAFRGHLLDHLAKQGGAPTNSNVRVDVGPGNAEQRAAAITNALQHRANPAGVELTTDGRNFRGLTLIEIGRDILEANGVNTRGMPRNEIAQQALAVRSGGMMTTSDFGGILANVANTTLRAGYQAAPQTFRPLVRETSVSDFKAITRAALGEAPALNKVNEHGEFKRGSLGEGKESYKIATYGKIVAITRQVIVNDDLDAFTRIPQAFGVQAAQLESDLVWAQILANPVMGDGKTLFHADHGNIITAGAIAVASLSNARTGFAKQTGLDGKTVLGLMPSYLIVPVGLQTIAEQLIGQIVATKASDVVPDSLKLKVIAEGRLDVGISRPEDDIVVAGNANAWYAAGNLAQADIVELAYLEGNRGVYTETRTGFDIDGIEIKARLDVGAKTMDWRNIAKNVGQ
jgi:phage major head subunit gpT-like protein